jgi:predicted DNA-binding protein
MKKTRKKTSTLGRPVTVDATAQLAVRFSAAQSKALRLASKAQGVTRAQVVRDAVDAYCKCA